MTTEYSALGERRSEGECTVATIQFSICTLFKVRDGLAKEKTKKSARESAL